MPGENVVPLAFDDYLRNAAVDRGTIDVFLDAEQSSWAQYDPITGYRLGNSLPRDGIAGSSTISTSRADGARTAHLYADQPCRINTYGDSFTQCHQVSDGETWQECLAAHLGEPVRNFGMGGFGVYQAYRRMVREEQTDLGAEFLILYAWGDDHVRSLLRCRHAAIYPWFDNSGPAFHCNFWANLEMDLETGELTEREVLTPTPESVYRMTDPDWMAESLRDDLALRLSAYAEGSIADLDLEAARRLAHHVGFDPEPLADPRPPRSAVRQLLDRYSLAATKLIFTKAREFAEQRNKKLLIVLFDPYRVLNALVERAPRYDQEIVDFLQKEDFHHFDMNLVHVEDYKSFAVPFDDYIGRYLAGHYNPAGNHFFAHALRSTLVDWLEPKPVTYRPTADPPIDFRQYLRT